MSFARTGLAGLTTLLLMAGAGTVHDATALSETRTLSFHHSHSGEDLTVTFKRNGRYDEDALRQLNHFLRDWRNQAKTTMDRHLFDILWEVYRDVDATTTIQIVSAYRSPSTNAMLRRRSSGVARSSQHMLGHAMDFFIPGVPVEKIRNAGLRLQRGGVGFYPTSGSPFVHLDTGSIRHWPRMTHDQLARVFPNGRTVHVPSNGGPLPGYELAMADIQKRGDGSNDSFTSKPSLFASLFKGRQNDDEDEAPAIRDVPTRAPRSVAAVQAPARPAPVVVATLAPSAIPVPSPLARPAAAGVIAAAMPAQLADLVPMPRAKPPGAALMQVAAVVPQAAPLPMPMSSPPRPPNPIPDVASVDTFRQVASADRPQTPADIINARAFWDDMPATPKQATPAQVAAITARQALANADPRSTATASTFSSALAYAPPSDATDRIVTASTPMPRFGRPSSPARNPMAITEVTTVVSKGPQGRHGNTVVNTARMAAAPLRDNDVWLRAMIIAPSATTTLGATAFGESDLTQMSAHFKKPVTLVAMSFSSDPMLGLLPNKFTGSVGARLQTHAFALRTASR